MQMLFKQVKISLPRAQNFFNNSYSIFGINTMIKCAILDDYQNVALNIADWSSLSDRVHVRSHQQYLKTEDELIQAVKENEIIVLMRERTPFGASVFERLPKLKLLITSGMRNLSIDMEAASKHGVIVSGTGNYSEPPVELAWGLIHALARNIILENKAVKAGCWQSTLGVDLKGKQLGLLGLGKTGAQMAKVGNAFGMNVVAWSENLTKERAADEGVQFARSKNELLVYSDFISIHLVLSPRTRNLIGSEEFHLMRKTSYLINTSRAGIVDQQALIDALQHKQIAGAASDVFEIEPLPENSVFRKLPNFIATPHIGYVTERNYKTYFGEAVENIQAYLEDRSLRQLNSPAKLVLAV